MNFSSLFAGIALLFQFATPVQQNLPSIFTLNTVGPAGVQHDLMLRTSSAQASAPVRIISESIGVDITARSALVVDKRSGAALWEKNADAQRPVASITKLAAMLVVLDALRELGREIEITATDYIPLGYNNFSVGERVQAKDLLAAAVIASDNTAMRALARATGLSADDFVDAMNKKAASLGLSHTTFVDPTGLSKENISTAREVIVLARKAFGQPPIASFARLYSYTFTSATGKQHVIKTTNQLIGGIVKVVAGKTGFVNDSGYNLVAEARRTDAGNLIAVVLGSEKNQDRFRDFKALAFWAWENYRWEET